MRIPAIGVDDLTVKLYCGRPDDARGTAFQNTGIVTGALGHDGQVLPGEVGAFVVAGHRTTAGAPFGRVPDLRNGDLVHVSWSGRVLTYRVTGRLWITYHDKASYARQVAAVPGHPGRTATRSSLVLTTCATPEDRATYGRALRFDAQGNPPHRIAVVATLVGQR